MMRILLLNDSYFLDSLRRLGHTVFFANPSDEADLKVGFESVHVNHILERCPFEPDFILISDSIDMRSAFLGLEAVGIPRVFFGVDSPMNAFWQFHYARTFDFAFFDQKSMTERFQLEHPDHAGRVHWLPLAADQRIYRPLDLEKAYDISFVGSLNDRLRPKRSWMLKELNQHFQVNVFDGGGSRSVPPDQVAQIYNRSKIVLNENLFPGLNLRTFEIMACGTCLVTEESDARWKDLFDDWKHLVAFRSDNLIENLKILLGDDQKREAIAQTGRQLVLEKHTIDHRAERLLSLVSENLLEQSVPQVKFGTSYLGHAFLQLSTRWPNQPVGELKAEGIRLLMDAAQTNVESAPLHYELAAQALEEGRTQDARASLQRALEIDPGHHRSRWAMFWCHRELGDAKAALIEIERFCHHLGQDCSDRKFFRRMNNGDDLELADYLFFADLLESAGWLIEPGIDRVASHPCRWNAFDALQRAIVLSPRSGAPHLRCAELLERCQSPDFAVIVLEKAAYVRPWDEALELKLAALLLRTYRRREGLHHLVNYLVRSMDVDKWESIETLHLTDSEMRFLLDKVWDKCRISQVALPSTFPKGMVRKIALNISGEDESQSDDSTLN